MQDEQPRVTIIDRVLDVYPMPGAFPLVKRRDIRADGSEDVTYYLELSEDQYRRLNYTAR